MKVFVVNNYDELSKKAFEIMKNVIVSNPSAVLGLATGASPIGLYNEMINDYKMNGTSYKNITTVNLDEYVGLDINSDQSYIYFMNENLFKGLDINKNKINLPNGKVDNMQAETVRYNNVLASHQQDIQLLGIGSNGHIGFNEPNTPFDSVTHIVELEEKTRMDNARFFSSLDEVPKYAITMGIANIMNAKSILVVASGHGKADAVKAMVEGEISVSCPASILQKHNNVYLVIDKEAGSKLSNQVNYITK